MLADAACVSAGDLDDQPLVFCNPINLVPEVAKLQWKLAEGRSPADLHFCASVEAAMVLAGAGFGVAVLPEFLVPCSSQLAVLPLKDAPELSYGMFYRPYPGDEIRKEFIQIAKQHFSDPGQCL